MLSPSLTAPLRDSFWCFARVEQRCRLFFGDRGVLGAEHPPERQTANHAIRSLPFNSTRGVDRALKQGYLPSLWMPTRY